MALHFNIKILSLPFLLLVSVYTYAQSPPDTENYWEKGVEARENGEYAKALSLWESAMEDNQVPDPRAGFSYIELVTDQELREFYKDASAMYATGLSGCTDDFTDELKEEIERVKPIVREEVYKQWRRSLKDNPEEVCKSLSNFWEKIDPTATTPYNERLIEHWERIAYSRENFRRGRRSAYNADERAPVYVKLGAPDYIRKGTLQFNSSLVRAWAQDGMELHTSFNTSGSSPSVMGDSGLNDSASMANRQRQYLMERVMKEVMAENIMKNARLQHRYPYHEIWVYRELLPETGENVIYIFGEDGNTGEFRMLRSIEEMIPNSAFRTTPVDRTPISPGFLLQMLFYEQTSIADHYFADAFNELQNNLFSLNNFNSRISYSIRHRKASQLRFLQYKAPQEKSTYLEEMPDIDLKVYQYRMLNEKNRPYLATFVESQPQKAFFFDQLKRREFDDSGYLLYHYSRLADTGNDVLDKQFTASQIFYEGSGNVDDMQKSATYFEIPYKSRDAEQVFSVELHNQNSDSSKLGEAVFPENIRAVSKIDKKQPKPLSVDPDELEVSDIVVGVAGEAENQHVRGPTTFKVLHDRVIPANQNMMVHFEVYHLTANSPGINRFEVEYQVNQKKSNIFQRIFGGSSEKVKLTLNFETAESFYVSDLEVATSPFEPGSYELSLRITEPLTGQTVEREVDFEISE